jgi:hypothetical protein
VTHGRGLLGRLIPRSGLTAVVDASRCGVRISQDLLSLVETVYRGKQGTRIGRLAVRHSALPRARAPCVTFRVLFRCRSVVLWPPFGCVFVLGCFPIS